MDLCDKIIENRCICSIRRHFVCKDTKKILAQSLPKQIAVEWKQYMLFILACKISGNAR